MVLKGTVDNNIFQIAQRKLRLDKEVLAVSTSAHALTWLQAHVSAVALAAMQTCWAVSMFGSRLCKDAGGGTLLLVMLTVWVVPYADSA